MDYEKKYNEALEKARKKYQEIPVDYLEYIFPELAESEDERIRRELMTHLQQEANSATLAQNRIMWEKMFAWVEKQKPITFYVPGKP